nr:DEAD/DEAH box helicase family protein [Ileibacterium valens]
MHLEFDRMFEQARIVDETLLEEYSENWIRPKLLNSPILEENYKGSEESDISENQLHKYKVIEPRDAQIEALYALNKTRQEGYSKALIQAATGVGKTYLAAFDSLSYQRILFVAHRQDILLQAAKAFKKFTRQKISACSIRITRTWMPRFLWLQSSHFPRINI